MLCNLESCLLGGVREGIVYVAIKIIKLGIRRHMF